MKKILLGVLFFGILTLNGCLPPTDKYPHKDPELIKQEAQAISDSLEAYIYKWTRGEVPSQIPDKYIPKGISDVKNFYLIDPSKATAEQTWVWRPARPVNLDSIYNGVPDPHVTYLYLAAGFASFGSKLVMEGEFPHARFFSVQITPPLNGTEYYANRYFGTAEVSMVDADIVPLPGNVNPFKLGAERDAPNRKYRLEFDLAIGDPVALNDQAHSPSSKFRQSGNKRTGAMLVYQGPWGMKTPVQTPIVGGGEWGTGALWVRYYAPDKSKGVLGGVPFPKLWYELPTGEKYFISADVEEFEKRTNNTIKARSTAPQPNLRANGPNVGWFKSFGIVRSILNTVAQVNGWTHPDTLKRIREIDLGATGRGEFQKAPGNYEPHATTNNYASYIGRGMTIEPEMVAVLTGKLPTFPDTRNGAQRMGGGQVRYWSIGGYDNDPLSPMPGAVLHNVMDDEITIDNDRNYVIAYSKPEARPANANSNNGVTWVNWGPTSDQGWMMRWVTVSPEWSFEKSPQEWNLPWSKADWSGSQYDSTLLGVNHYKGWMGCYLPRVTYMTKQEFEALGNNISAEDIPVWVDNRNIIGLSESKNKPANGSSILKNDPNNKPSKAFDGNLNTAWASDWRNGAESITVDLGTSMKISGVKLTWEFVSQASSYEIQVSDNNESFSTIYSTTTADGGIDIINNLHANGRYVRMAASKGPLGGYILKEMEVFSPQMNCNVPVTSRTKSISKESDKISVYPNPASQYLKLDIMDFEYTNGTPIEVSIHDANAKLYIKQTIKNSHSEVNISELEQGAYIINLKYDNKNHSHHFNIIKN